MHQCNILVWQAEFVLNKRRIFRNERYTNQNWPKVTSSICALNTGSPCLMLPQPMMFCFIMLPNFKIQQSDEHCIPLHWYYFAGCWQNFQQPLLGIFRNVVPTLNEDLMPIHFHGHVVTQIPLPHTWKSHSKLSKTNMPAAFSQKFWSFMFSSENCTTKLHYLSTEEAW